jgi:hypothetical protein
MRYVHKALDQTVLMLDGTTLVLSFLLGTRCAIQVSTELSAFDKVMDELRFEFVCRGISLQSDLGRHSH